MAYMSPGGAFSQGFQETMAKRAAEERQATLDQILLHREKRANEAATAAEEDRKAGLKLRQDEANAKADDRERSIAIQERADMLPGDIPSAEQVARFKQLRVPFKVGTPIMDAQMPEAPAGIISPDVVPNEPVRPQGTPTTPVGPMMAGRFEGDPKQRLEEQRKADIKQKISMLPAGSPQRMVLENELLGAPSPAGMFQIKGAPEGVFRQHPDTGAFERLVPDAQGKPSWEPWAGDVPDGAHILAAKVPVDRSVANAINADRDERRLDVNKEHAYSEFTKMGTNLEAGMRDFDRLGTLLNQHNSQGDADAAILLLKATAGGEGSGLRMTQSEINNTLGGRTKWESLDSVMRRWSSTPQKATIPDEQRANMLKLGKTIRDKMVKMHSALMDARHQVDESDDAKSILRLRSKVHDDMFPAESSLDTHTESDEAVKARAKALLDAARGVR